MHLQWGLRQQQKAARPSLDSSRLQQETDLDRGVAKDAQSLTATSQSIAHATCHLQLSTLEASYHGGPLTTCFLMHQRTLLQSFGSKLLWRFLNRNFCLAYVLSRQLASKLASTLPCILNFFAFLFFHDNHLEGV